MKCARNVLIFTMTAMIWLACAAFRQVYALDLSRTKACFLSGDYKAAISAGEAILSQTEEVPQLDELYYLLGLSYFKDGNVLRATDIFEIIINEFKSSPLRADASLALGDAYYTLQKFDKAKKIYLGLLADRDSARLSPMVYARLSECALMAGDTQEAKKYADALHQKFPLYCEPDCVSTMSGGASAGYYVQVGVFSKKSNAERLVAKLTSKGYIAHIDTVASAQGTSFCVRVGSFIQRNSAQEAVRKLSKEGYLARIIP